MVAEVPFEPSTEARILFGDDVQRAELDESQREPWMRQVLFREKGRA